MAEFIKVADVNDLTPGRGKVIEVKGKTIALFNVGGTYYALDNTCLHRGGPLGEGDLEGNIVTCPWHGWQYDVTTGTNNVNPSIKVETYPVKIEGSEVKVAI